MTDRSLQPWLTHWSYLEKLHSWPFYLFFYFSGLKKENGLHLVSSFLCPRGHFQNLANLSKKRETECCKCHQSNVQSRNWFLNNLQLSITGLKWVKTVKMASTYDCGLGSPCRALWMLPYLFLNHPVPSSSPVHRSWAHKAWLGAPSPKHYTYCCGWCVRTRPGRYCWDCWLHSGFHNAQHSVPQAIWSLRMPTVAHFRPYITF